MRVSHLGMFQRLAVDSVASGTSWSREIKTLPLGNGFEAGWLVGWLDAEAGASVRSTFPPASAQGTWGGGGFIRRGGHYFFFIL